jgi:hypothetical protein
LFDYPTLESLAGHVVRDMLQMETESVQASVDSEQEVNQEKVQAVADVEEMSEEEMEAVVMRQLQKLNG